MKSAQLLDFDTGLPTTNVLPLHRPDALHERMQSLPDDLIAQFLDEDDEEPPIGDQLPEHHVLVPGDEASHVISIDEFAKQYRDLHALETEYHKPSPIEAERILLAHKEGGDRDRAVAAARQPAIATLYAVLKSLRRSHVAAHLAGRDAALRDLKRLRAEDRSA